jgi:hypothetical protein
VCVSSAAARAQTPWGEWDPRFAPAGPDTGFQDFVAFDDGRRRGLAPRDGAVYVRRMILAASRGDGPVHHV